ncbi:MAG: endolytic transglycosylase MltG [Muribaculaceae bacterium]|nr:endolytic transglycosylase MltG [Muribaculaceae bacterium]
MQQSPDRANGSKKPKANSSHKKKKTNKKRPGRSVWILSGIALFVAAGIGFIAPYAFSVTHHPAIIRIPANADKEVLSDTLSHYYGSDFAAKVIRCSKTAGLDVPSRHGAYLIDDGTSAWNVARRLATADQEPVSVVINGFRSPDVLAQRLSRRLELSAVDLSLALRDSALLASYGLNPDQTLALVTDGTHRLLWSDSPEEVVKKFGTAFNNIWTPERRAKADSLGLSPTEVMIIASIADEETAKADEKATIARLYMNRLKKGMRLQADPTVRFATGDFSIRRITGQHLRTPSPYNTYLHTGLPPAPIRTTSVATIDAVLNAPEHDYLYMCAKEDFSGYHNFAVSFDEHKENAARYQQALDERGIH